jgi:hypothetical protein
MSVCVFVHALQLRRPKHVCLQPGYAHVRKTYWYAK